MKRQKSLANAKSFEKHRVEQTRREKFLAEMDKAQSSPPKSF